jgi:hypothetical protein
MALSALRCTWMSSEVELLPGALDLILSRALEAMGPQHAYSLAARLEQVSRRWGRLAGLVDALLLNEP